MKTEATVLMMMMLVLKVLIDAFCTLQDCCTNAFSLRQVVGLIYTCCVHNIGSDSQEAATCSICGCALPAVQNKPTPDWTCTSALRQAWAGHYSCRILIGHSMRGTAAASCSHSSPAISSAVIRCSTSGCNIADRSLSTCVICAFSLAVFKATAARHRAIF